MWFVRHCFPAPPPHEEPAAETRKNTPSSEHTQSQKLWFLPHTWHFSLVGLGNLEHLEAVTLYLASTTRGVWEVCSGLGVQGPLCDLLCVRGKVSRLSLHFSSAKRPPSPPPEGLRCVRKAFTVASARLTLGVITVVTARVCLALCGRLVPVSPGTTAFTRAVMCCW